MAGGGREDGGGEMAEGKVGEPFHHLQSQLLYYVCRVEIHESYKFVSKSYGNMEYHFRSIETWLKGICRR